MEKEKQSDTILEVREESMVSPTGGDPTVRKAHFLKPTFTANDGEISELPPGCFSRKQPIQNLKHLSGKIVFKGWKRPTEKWKRWVQSMHSKHQALWKQVGIYEAVMSSRYAMKKRKELVLALAEMWCPSTNTFIFPWGEATITLEDLMVSGGYSVLGESVLSPLKTEELIEVEEKLIVGRKEAATVGAIVATNKAWMQYFMETGHELEHEAFLSYWLSNFVLVESSHSTHFVGKHVFPMAIHLARGTRVALAPAVLSSIYRDLGVLKDQLFGSNLLQIIGELNLYAPFQLVQLWLWERFPGLRPTPNSIKHGEPRVARWQWHRLQKNVDDMKLDIGSAGTEFQWRPYTLAVNGWSFPKFYGDKEQYIPLDSHLDEEVKSFAICLRVSELVGLESIEQYLPHRVAMQFGMDQDLPGCFVRCNRKPEIAWRNYSRPMGDAEIYIPPRLFESDVTVTYSDWWKQSIKVQCDVIKQFVKRPRSPRELLNVSKRKKESHILLSPDYPLKWGEVSRGESAKKNGGVEAGDLIEEEMEDGLIIREFFARTKHNSKKIGGETESRLCAQSPLPSTKEIETPATMKPCEVSREAPLKDQNDVILENVGNGDNIGCIVTGDSLPLSVGRNQNVSSSIADKDVKRIKLEVKQGAEVTRNTSSTGEPKGLVAADIKREPSPTDAAGEGSSSHDFETQKLQLEARISSLEKLFAELKEEKFGKKWKAYLKGGSSKPK
ncbi:hypothetical protein COLO4_09639 [Corchorus olitorius]|uniref:Aminotransferase-like plant mobile domain-containing protein n=1 Tax=Corchorus olitorius TaxID=93759 RepID=A0A1R3KBM4_9ROSI|nr:hypothetical protein COLO4_09639 [Corchorus olitorius]